MVIETVLASFALVLIVSAWLYEWSVGIVVTIIACVLFGTIFKVMIDEKPWA